jgi:hypothetical protein
MKAKEAGISTAVSPLEGIIYEGISKTEPLVS